MKFAIIGATGNVGRKTIDILEKSKLDIEQLHLVASKNSLGKKIKFKGNDLAVVALEDFNFEGQNNSISKAMKKIAINKSGIMIIINDSYKDFDAALLKVFHFFFPVPPKIFIFSYLLTNT